MSPRPKARQGALGCMRSVLRARGDSLEKWHEAVTLNCRRRSPQLLREEPKQTAM
jgi:hypothetical protein